MKPVQIGYGYEVAKMGMDTNGNFSVWVRSLNNRAKKIQTLGNLPKLHRSRVINAATAGEILEYLGVGYLNRARKANPIDRTHKNIMGTASFDAKFPGMRKPQDFIVYPIGSGQDASNLLIQSDTRIGRIDLKTGKVTLTKAHPSGAYNHHLHEAKLVETLSGEDLLKIKGAVAATASGRAGSSIMLTDNAGAIDVFARNPAKKKKAVGRRSQITGRAPSARLKRRRAKQKVQGYFPNPSKAFDEQMKHHALKDTIHAEIITKLEALHKVMRGKANLIAKQAEASFVQGFIDCAYKTKMITRPELSRLGGMLSDIVRNK